MAVVYDKEILYSSSVTGNDHLIIRHMILYSHYTNTELPSIFNPYSLTLSLTIYHDCKMVAGLLDVVIFNGGCI